MSQGMAEELWPLEEAVKRFLQGRKSWKEQSDTGLTYLMIPVAEIEDLEVTYEEVQEALDQIEEDEG